MRGENMHSGILEEIKYINSNENMEVSFGEYINNTMSTSHAHDDFELYVLIEGERKLFVKEQFYNISDGTVFLIKPGTPHRTINCEDTHYIRLVCNVSPEWMKQLDGVMELYCLLMKNDVYIIKPDSEDLAALLLEIKRIKSVLALKPPGYELSLTITVMKILSLFFKYKSLASEKAINSGGYERIAEITKYINNNYNVSISISALAEKFFISEFYMCRLFKEYTGKTIISYINYIRISKAKQLLSETDIKIKLLYKQCGFITLSNFNKCFKESCSLTPLQYRKMYGKGVETTKK